MRLKKLTYSALPICLSALLAACNGGNSSPGSIPLVPVGFTISGTVSGLAQESQITLSNNGEMLIVSALANSDTNFKFKNSVNSGGNYQVTVNQQPTGATCSVVNAAGTGVAGNVDNVRVICGTSVLHALSGNDGAYPQTSLLPLGDLLYGTTSQGGVFTTGTIFQVSPTTGAFMVLSDFTGVNGDGKSPFAGLVAGGDGNLYGTTFGGGSNGGVNGFGTFFSINLTSKLKTSLYSFTGATDGNNPFAGLIFDGTDFYGTTRSGGNNGRGAVFAVNASGQSRVVYTFPDSGDEGANPSAGLTFGSDGNLYGTTYAGGTFQNGTIYKVSPTGTFTLLHNFKTTDGAQPQTNLILASQGGNFYGTTTSGGDNNCNCGTVYMIDPSGNFSVLHAFTGAPKDGGNAQSSLIVGSDGYLYGTTNGGGANNKGTIYRISLTGEEYSVLHSFNTATDGAGPSGPLTQLSDGHFYGTAATGGTGGQGTVFRF